MSNYTLINNLTGEKHDLDFENISDIQHALWDIEKFNKREFPYDTAKRRESIFMNNCFRDTVRRMAKVSVPNTDY